MMTFDKYCSENNINLMAWQSVAAHEFLKHIFKYQRGADGKSFLIGVLSGFISAHGNHFSLGDQ